jgi:drug/metabolite transporter (DMT)-like permease
MAAGAFFFALMSLLVKIAGQRLPTMEVVLARSVVILVLTWGWLRVKRIPIWGSERRLLLLRGVLGFVALSCFYYGVIHLPLADATVIQYTNPVWTVLLAAAFLAERVGRREVALSLASLAGVVLMARPTFLFGGDAPALPPIPVAVALGGALFSAAAYVTVRRLRAENPMVIVFWFALVSTVASLPFVARSFVVPTVEELVILLGVGLATQAGQVFLTLGLREERAGRAMAVAYLQIVFAALWGLAVFAEVPDRWTLAGAGVIVVCTWLLGRIPARP